MKAAHAGVGGAPCRKSGYMGQKRIFQMLSLHDTRILALGRSPFTRVAKTFEGLRRHFRPTYAGANIDWIRKKASAILERVLRFGTERLRDQEKPYEDYRM
jgi:hypothetical protein